MYIYIKYINKSWYLVKKFFDIQLFEHVIKKKKYNNNINDRCLYVQ